MFYAITYLGMKTMKVLKKKSQKDQSDTYIIDIFGLYRLNKF